MKYYLTQPRNNEVCVVGCGGTGGFVAEGLCRLLPKDYTLVLIDHDRVEEHNLLRQSFFQDDIGKFKSQALAERLSRLYRRPILYSVKPFSNELVRDSFMGSGFYTSICQGLLIGCVDNAEARKAMSRTGNPQWYLDSGNGEHSGQVLIGSESRISALENSFKPVEQIVFGLPSPVLQQPSLLAPTAEPVPAADCAENIALNGQSPVINQAMASLVLHFVHKLIKGQLDIMGAYLDLDNGSLSTVPATPEIVSRMTGLTIKQLTQKNR